MSKYILMLSIVYCVYPLVTKQGLTPKYLRGTLIDDSSEEYWKVDFGPALRSINQPGNQEVRNVSANNCNIIND